MIPAGTRLVDVAGSATAYFLKFLNDLERKTYSGEMVYDPASVASGAATAIANVPCPGAQLGMAVSASFSNDLQGLALNAWVSSSNVVSVNLLNLTGGGIDLASGTLKVTACKP